MIDETSQQIYKIVERKMEELDELRSVGVEVNNSLDLAEAYYDVNLWLKTLADVRRLPQVNT